MSHSTSTAHLTSPLTSNSSSHLTSNSNQTGVQIQSCMYGCKYSGWKWTCKFFTNISDADNYTLNSTGEHITRLVPVHCKYDGILPKFIQKLGLHSHLSIPIKID